ncbi:MAG: 2-oxoacid:acceptor oxidoreductase subunit alpha [Methanomassiliicoccales archaeon]|nr:MAG: 2-oxoacid:acceptor oxidoreductase subunit alpha [Methanomassiliicoccales archaeon]
MHGDFAVAEGGLAAGCGFFAGYPITPATEVAERMAARLPEVDGMYIQMEDEMGSMAAILGASCAGVKSMTSTSGPGFSLMQENIGLGAMMEIPAVVVNIQRGGPSTGMPTLVGQQDMMQARWGSHGDYPIIAYCPASPQECFDLVIEAFNAAERYRTPVLVMADEIVGHMTERVVIPEEKEIKVVERKRPKGKPIEYLPYQAEEDLIPPMAIAGEGYKVRMTGLTHDEKGRPAISAEAEGPLLKRLLDKVSAYASDIVRYEERDTDDADVIVISYGITSRCANRAVELARKEGIEAGLFRLITAWPFPVDRVRELSEGAKGMIVPEINYGQMVLEVERVVCGRAPVKGVTYVPGTLPDPDATLKAIREVAK